MKNIFLICCVMFLVYFKTSEANPKMDFYNNARCVNLWDEGCINGQLPGSGSVISNYKNIPRSDDDYLNGGFNPGKRCMDVWDHGCVDGRLVGAGADDDYLGGNFNPGKRSLYELLAKLQRKHQFY